MGSEWVAPTITGILALITLTTAEIIRRKNNRSTSREERAPDVMDAWAEANRARKRSYVFEDMFYTVRAALKNLVRSLAIRDPDYEIPKDVRAALELQPPNGKEHQ